MKTLVAALMLMVTTASFASCKIYSTNRSDEVKQILKSKGYKLKKISLEYPALKFDDDYVIIKKCSSDRFGRQSCHDGMEFVIRGIDLYPANQKSPSMRFSDLAQLRSGLPACK